MSNYSKAISNHETRDFLLGNGIYLYPDSERYGLHDMSLTFNDIQEYSKEVGAAAMLERLQHDIKNILRSTISSSDFSKITGYIFLCLRGYHEDGIFDAELTIDEEFRSLYREKLNQLEEGVGQSISVGNVEPTGYTDEYYLNNAKRIASLIKEKFGVSLT
ncbi:hypothetical protein [Flavobacterium aurantiibacter]|uniref:Uncharacterized protein n=1 Tax=Flavobacterium aurantiibacter TaxID=2023067 RepID=A0A256AAH3_9FLAO|nr:hypothetical protein [Flavobacterium aurantiibacter]OYQ50641.1 hypothetical protein CHX27_00760 [Flavobacterium aurantiibacter]